MFANVETGAFYGYDCIFLHFNLKLSDVRMAGYSLSSLENHLDSLGASYVDGVKVRVNPRYSVTPMYLSRLWLF